MTPTPRSGSSTALFLRAFGHQKQKASVARRVRRPLDVSELEWRQLRARVFERDGFACVYCSVKMPRRELQADHVMPRALGGASTLENLATACGPCNRAKGSMTPAEWNGARSGISANPTRAA